MKKAIMYGAGNIGRGFIGYLFAISGYEVVFIDVNPDIVGKLNADRAYPVRIVSQASQREIIVNNVRAVDGGCLEEVAAEIATADMMATAVGVNIVPHIIPNIAAGLKKRWETGNFAPLNIIICENLMNANHYFRDLISRELQPVQMKYFEDLVGLVEASIGRMVPVMTPEMQEGNILRIWVEEYCQLPVDAAGFKGEIPAIAQMFPYRPFEFYIHRKLFIHNLGHAVTAYAGNLKGYTYIWEAIGNEEIRMIAAKAMSESANGLSLEYGIPLAEIEAHIADLIARFGNQYLRDTVERVGRDPVRKLAANDRLIGAANLCLKHGIKPEGICTGIAAALCFNVPGDKAATEMNSMILQGGIEAVLTDICGLNEASPLWEMVLTAYAAVRKENS